MTFLVRGRIIPTLRNLKKLQQQLPSFKQYLEKHGLIEWIDTDAFAQNLSKGLYFDANIPTGYGVGSSGALCAAILSKFGKRKQGTSSVSTQEDFCPNGKFFSWG